VPLLALWMNVAKDLSTLQGQTPDIFLRYNEISDMIAYIKKDPKKHTHTSSHTFTQPFSV
jgi:hypothetical protein